MLTSPSVIAQLLGALCNFRDVPPSLHSDMILVSLEPLREQLEDDSTVTMSHIIVVPRAD